MTGPTLLTYELGWTPTPVLASTPVALSVTADNTSGRDVALSSVAIVLPLGANADDLAATLDGSGSVAPPGWTAAHAAGSDTVTFAPDQGPEPVRGQGLTFALPAIAVNDQPGTTTPVEIVENAAENDGPVTARTYAEPVRKFPAGFSLSDLVADPATPIEHGGDVTLRWTGSAGPTYTLERSDRPDDPPAAVGNDGPQVVQDLTGSEFVVFTLTATVGVPDQDPLHYAKQCIVTVLESPPDIRKFTADFAFTEHGPQLTVSWHVTHVKQCEVDELPGGLFSNDHTEPFTPTDDWPLPTQLTLKARNGAGTATRTLYLSWGNLVRSQTLSGGTTVALAPDGERIYTAQYEGLAVLDAVTLAPLFGPAPLTRYAAAFVAVSADSTRIYMAIDYAAVYAYDVTTLPPVPLGDVAGGSFTEWALWMAITPDGGLLLVGDIVGGSVLPFRTSGDRTDPVRALAPVAVDDQPVSSVAVTAGGSRLYRFAPPSGLAAIDLDTLALVAGTPAALPVNADAIAPAAADGSIYVFGAGVVTNRSGDNLCFGVHRLDPDPPFAVRAAWGDGTAAVAGAAPSADGRVLYVLAMVGTDGVLEALSPDALEPVPMPGTPVGPVPMLGPPEVDQWVPAAIAQPADGTRLYVGTATGVSMLTPSGYIHGADA